MIIRKGIIGAVLLFLASAVQTFAVFDQSLKVSQGTNLVLSWPSLGYEQYLIQYRPDLNDGTPWTQLTNNCPANSTNRTTYTIYGVIPPPVTGGTNGGSPAGGPPFIGAASMVASTNK